MFSASAVAAARAEGVAEGRTAERARIRAILAASEARGRALAAARLAFEADLDTPAALGLLAAEPEEVA